MNKKAQITIFIIIGILILFSSALIFYIRNQIVSQNIVTAHEPSLETIPNELVPVRLFVENCIYQIAYDGLTAIGQQGGYIDTSKLKTTGGTNPTEDDGVTLVKGQSLVVPYWHYLKSRNTCDKNCQFSSKKPNLYRIAGEPSIEGQLDRYTAEKLKACLNNFKDIKKEGFEISEIGNVKTTVNVAEKDVNFLVEYPIKVKKGSSESQITKYYVKMPVNLKKLYNIAGEITNLEINNEYLEKNTMNVIAAFATSDNKRLPPLSLSTPECFGGNWIKTNVKNDVTSLLETYVPLLRVYKSKYADYGDFTDPMQRGLYDQMVITLNETDPTGIGVQFNYANFWPMYFDINPKKGELLIPITNINVPLLRFCITRYKFAYDMSFPVVVEMEDPNAFNGQGYFFRFAMESNIRRNQNINLTRDQSKDTDESLGLGESSFCNEEQKLSGNITMTFTDKSTGKPVAGVNPFFCVPDADGECTSDMCAMRPSDSVGKTVEKFPLGIGVMYTNKDDYQDYAQTFGTALDKPYELNIQLDPLRTRNISVQKKIVEKECELKDNFDYTTLIPGVYFWSSVAGETDSPWAKVQLCQWVFKEDKTEPLADYENAMLNFERIGEPGEKIYTTFVSINGSSKTEIKLLPGKYKVDINIITSKKITIPRDTKKICSSRAECLIMSGGNKTYAMDEIKLDSFVSGGAVFDDPAAETASAGYWEISQPGLDNSNEIVFNIIGLNMANLTKHDDLQLVGLFGNFSKDYSSKIQPEMR